MSKNMLEMAVKGFDGLTGIALFISAFGMGAGFGHLNLWGWTLAFIFIGLNVILRTVVYFLEKFVCKA